MAKNKKQNKMAQPTKQEMEQHLQDMRTYLDDELKPYVDAYDESGTNPQVPLPPKPPKVHEE